MPPTNPTLIPPHTLTPLAPDLIVAQELRPHERGCAPHLHPPVLVAVARRIGQAGAAVVEARLDVAGGVAFGRAAGEEVAGRGVDGGRGVGVGGGGEGEGQEEEGEENGEEDVEEGEGEGPHGGGRVDGRGGRVWRGVGVWCARTMRK